jgi:hypothetical protein
VRRRRTAVIVAVLFTTVAVGSAAAEPAVHAFMRDRDGAILTIDSPGTLANGINDPGQIVGA